MNDVSCLGEWFQRLVRRDPDQSIISFGHKTWSRRELSDHVAALSEQLVGQGIRQGHRVGYIGLDHPVLLVTLFAATSIGAIFVPLNSRLADEELATIVGDAGIRTLLCGAEHADQVDRLRSRLGCRDYLVHVGARDGFGMVASGAADGASGITGFRVKPTVKPSDVALLVYTSGTTGVPKGVILTHDNIWMSNIGTILANGISGADVGINCCPLFHAAGLNTLTLPLLMAGGHLILQPRFDEAAYFRSVAQYGATLGLLVPTMMVRLASHESFLDADLSSMRLMMSGGAPVRPDILDIFNQRGIVTNQGYGMTESTAAALVLESHYATQKLGSCGRPSLIADVKLISSDGTQIDTPHTPGEICLRGRSITAGYWNRREETAAAISEDGWLRSGDIAYFDDEGFYFMCDRLKDMIICGGENIYAAEIENVLSGHPAIFEIAVVGRPHPEWGEVVIAFAVLNGTGGANPEELNGYAADRLSRYKLPREYHFLDELPKTATGKISKPKLRDLIRIASGAA